MNNDDLKLYSWHPEAFEKLTPERRIEFWNMMLARIDFFFAKVKIMEEALVEIKTGGLAAHTAAIVATNALDAAAKVVDSKSEGEKCK